MGNITKPQKAKLFIGIILKNESLYESLARQLCLKFGRIDFESSYLNFNYTDHYEGEMGVNLKRKFISFENLILPDKIAKIKNITNKIESRFRKNRKRQINLDPGYLNDAKIILATTKNYSHRIYLKNGIYAEVTLSFLKNTFTANPWAYPDYQSNDYIAIFNQMRQIFMRKQK
ncbi:MAG TPA: DUF4416 family protein [Candidatus Omnitrophica bacterium]|nr:DUF4416 family protein [Candidatus Omnitrophota bacterium]